MFVAKQRHNLVLENKMKKFSKQLVWLIATLGMVGCGSILSPQSQRQIKTYEIVDNSLHDDNIPSCIPPKDNAILYVSPVRASVPYETYKMYYTAESYSLNNYAYSQWIVPAGELIHQNIIKKLVLSCSFKNVVTSTAIANANYRLVTNLVSIRQEINPANNTANAHVILSTELIDLEKNTIVATFVFDEKQPTDVGPTGYVTGVSQLITKYDDQLVNWLQQNAK